MRKDTHDEYFEHTDEDGNVSRGFLSGVPDQCKHDDDGEALYFNEDGKYWKESELPTDETYRYEFMRENNINGGCVSCSKCGKPFSPDFNAMP